jgi:hypothetical protein
LLYVVPDEGSSTRRLGIHPISDTIAHIRDCRFKLLTVHLGAVEHWKTQVSSVLAAIYAQ